jgi:hypothetical protein
MTTKTTTLFVHIQKTINDDGVDDGDGGDDDD